MSHRANGRIRGQPHAELLPSEALLFLGLGLRASGCLFFRRGPFMHSCPLPALMPPALTPLPRSNGFGSAAPAESLAEWRLTSPKDARSAWRLLFSKTSCKGCGARRVPCYGVATAVYLRFSRMPSLALKTLPSPNCTKVSELGIPLTRSSTGAVFNRTNESRYVTDILHRHRIARK